MKKQIIFITFLIFTPFINAQNTTTSIQKNKGFIFELGTGAGIISLDQSDNSKISFDKSQGAFYLPELKLGWMLKDHLAATLFIPGIIYENDANNNHRHLGGFIPSLQYWTANDWWFQGGIGLATDTPALYDIKDTNDYIDFGCAFTAGLGYDLYKDQNCVLNFQSKVIMSRVFLENDATRDAVSLTVGLAIQWM